MKTLPSDLTKCQKYHPQDNKLQGLCLCCCRNSSKTKEFENNIILFFESHKFITDPLLHRSRLDSKLISLSFLIFFLFFSLYFYFTFYFFAFYGTNCTQGNALQQTHFHPTQQRCPPLPSLTCLTPQLFFVVSFGEDLDQQILLGSSYSKKINEWHVNLITHSFTLFRN